MVMDGQASRGVTKKSAERKTQLIAHIGKREYRILNRELRSLEYFDIQYSIFCSNEIGDVVDYRDKLLDSPVKPGNDGWRRMAN